MSLFVHRPLVKIALVLAILVAAWTMPSARRANAMICEYGYIDTIYPNAMKRGLPCGEYNSCTGSHTGCNTSYRTTQITYCCGGL